MNNKEIKQPSTVKIIDPEKIKKIRLIKQQTGIKIEKIIDELLEAGLRKKKFV